MFFLIKGISVSSQADVHLIFSTKNLYYLFCFIVKQLEEEKSVFKETINAQFETMYFSIANCLSNFAVSGHNIQD